MILFNPEEEQCETRKGINFWIGRLITSSAWNSVSGDLVSYLENRPAKEAFVSILDSTRKRIEVWVKIEWEAIITDHVH